MAAAGDEEENPGPDGPVTDRLCEARRDALREEIHSIKLAVYAVGFVLAITLTIMQIIISLLLK